MDAISFVAGLVGVPAPVANAAAAAAPLAAAPVRMAGDVLTVGAQVARDPRAAWDQVVATAKARAKAAAGAFLGISWAPFEVRNEKPSPAKAVGAAPEEAKAATEALAAHAAAERAALAKLAPGDRARYEAVQAIIVDHPVAARALQQLLFDGKLAPGLLAGFENLTKAPLAPGLDRAKLLAQVIGEVQDPVRIFQGQRNTCGATTSQLMLAGKDPQEYVRLVTGLASPAGKVAMAGGGVLERKADWQAEDGDRSLPSKLLQPAFMEYAEVAMAYNNSTDHSEVGGVKLLEGLTGLGAAALQGQLFGKPYVDIMPTAANRHAVATQLLDLLKAGKGPISASFYGQVENGHFLRLDRVEGDRVYVTNPWGVAQSMSLADFEAHLLTVQVPKGDIAPGTATAALYEAVSDRANVVARYKRTAGAAWDATLAEGRRRLDQAKTAVQAAVPVVQAAAPVVVAAAFPGAAALGWAWGKLRGK